MRPKLRGGGGLKISFFAFQDIITSVTGILILVTLILTMYLKPAAESAPAATPITSQSLDSEIATVQAGATELKRQLDDLLDLPSSAELRKSTEQVENETARVQADLNNLRQKARHSTDTPQQKAFAQAISEISQKTSELQQRILATNSLLTNLLQVAARTNSVLDKLAEELQHEQANTDTIRLIPGASNDGKIPVVILVSQQGASVHEFASNVSPSDLNATDLRADPTAAFRRFTPDRQSLVFFVRPSGIELFRELRQSARRGGFSVGYDLIEENKQLQLTSGK
jgi:hypothetical protein